MVKLLGEEYQLLMYVLVVAACILIHDDTEVLVSGYGDIVVEFLEIPKLLQVLFTNPSARAGYDTRSILKQSLTGLNSEFSFS